MSGSAALELLGDLCFTTYASFGAASGPGDVTLGL